MNILNILIKHSLTILSILLIGILSCVVNCEPKRDYTNLTSDNPLQWKGLIDLTENSPVFIPHKCSKKRLTKK